MLLLERKPEQWVILTHRRTGEVIRVLVCELRGDRLNLGFEDDARNFDIERAERRRKPAGP